jgi:hypothetical protein
VPHSHINQQILQHENFTRDALNFEDIFYFTKCNFTIFFQLCESAKQGQITMYVRTLFRLIFVSLFLLKLTDEKLSPGVLFSKSVDVDLRWSKNISQEYTNRPFIKELSNIFQEFSNRHNNFFYPTQSNKLSLKPNNVPPQALANGFSKKTFSSYFTFKNFDLRNTRKTGFKWYPWRFFSYKPSETSLAQINTDSSITLLGDKKSYNANIATATPGNSPGTFWGTAFGGGGYFEASLKFNSNSFLNKHGCPAFWAMALEHLVPLPPVQWPRMPKGYEHFIEVDILEFNHADTRQYTGTMHEWYGTIRSCSGFYCQATPPYSSLIRRVPLNTNFSQYHKYGFLWVPATRSTKGYAEYYFDGKKIGDRTSWSQYTNQPPPPGSQPWTFGIIDKQHLVLILGTGYKQPLTIRSVNVWQASAAQNITKTIGGQ